MVQESSVPQASFFEDLRQGAANLGSYLGARGNPPLRLGVTGLSRAGKTVFITGLVHGLIARSRLPAFRAAAEGRIREVRLGEHADDALPRFDYEHHLAALTGPDRQWPHSTRQISALRLEIGFQSRRAYLGGLLGPAGVLGGGLSRLSLDIVDYPGEWLLDLPLLAQSYDEFCTQTLKKAETGARKPLFAPYLALLDEIAPEGPASEGEMRRLADSFTLALRACREEGRGLSALAPGRFLLPGDLEGAPALTFAPLRPGAPAPAGSLAALMARRYEAYKARIVRPFFIEHFANIDRQIVLVDVLSALNGGSETLADLETALVGVLDAFKVGAQSLWASVFAPRVTRILFAATKADHLHHSQHDRLEAILRLLVRRAWHRAKAAGSDTGIVALAGIRATREVSAKEGARQGLADLPCIAGIPMRGEALDGHVFDGQEEVAFFPGDLPDSPERAFADPPLRLRFIGFRPPLRAKEEPEAGLPSIRLDRALEFLIGDALA